MRPEGVADNESYLGTDSNQDSALLEWRARAGKDGWSELEMF